MKIKQQNLLLSLVMVVMYTVLFTPTATLARDLVSHGTPITFHSNTGVWTHNIGTSDNLDSMFLYDSNTGEAVTIAFGSDGNGNILKHYPEGTSFDPGWTHIVHVGGGVVLWYNSNTGDISSGYFKSGEYVPNIYTNPGPYTTGYTHVASAGVGDGTVLFYDSATGKGQIVDMVFIEGGVSNYEPVVIESLPEGTFSTGWTHLVSYPYDNMHMHISFGIFWYNSNSGSAAFGTLGINFDNKFTQLKSYPEGTFSLGWTDISFTPKGGLLWYNTVNDKLAYGLLDSDGNFTQEVSDSGLGQPGWTRIVVTTKYGFEPSEVGILFYDSILQTAEMWHGL